MSWPGVFRRLLKDPNFFKLHSNICLVEVSFLYFFFFLSFSFYFGFLILRIS